MSVGRSHSRIFSKVKIREILAFPACTSCASNLEICMDPMLLRRHVLRIYDRSAYYILAKRNGNSFTAVQANCSYTLIFLLPRHREISRHMTLHSHSNYINYSVDMITYFTQSRVPDFSGINLILSLSSS